MEPTGSGVPLNIGKLEEIVVAEDLWLIIIIFFPRDGFWRKYTGRDPVGQPYAAGLEDRAEYSC